MEISIIAAIANHNVIGKNGQLPWHLPADLIHFKRLTLNKPIIMGRKTFESIGRALPERENIIITSCKNYQAPNCKIFHSLEEAFTQIHVPEAMVIGGETLYKQALSVASTLYLTYINAEIEGDVFFPDFNRNEWKETSRENHQADDKNLYDFSFVTLKRR